LSLPCEIAEFLTSYAVAHGMTPAEVVLHLLEQLAVPFLLERLRQKPDHWFWALKSITGADPVDDDDRGDLRAMSRAWLDWGFQHGYS
jgi:hypothetical protein